MSLTLGFTVKSEKDTDIFQLFSPIMTHWLTIQMLRNHFPGAMILLAILNYLRQFNLFSTSCFKEWREVTSSIGLRVVKRHMTVMKLYNNLILYLSFLILTQTLMRILSIILILHFLLQSNTQFMPNGVLLIFWIYLFLFISSTISVPSLIIPAMNALMEP